MGVAGLGSSLISGFGAQNAANARNQQRRDQAKIESKRSEFQYDLQNWQAGTQWAWDMARTSQLRVVETQNQLDNLVRGNQLIDSAIQNFQLNSAALQDIYGTQEDLRAAQEGLEFGYQSNELARNMQNQITGYLRAVQQRTIAATNLVSQTQRQAQELQQSLLLDQQQDNLTYNVRRLEAALQDSKSKAVFSARQGTGATSKKLAMEAGQQIGKLAVELDIKAKNRRTKNALFNSYMQNEVSGEIASFALQSERDVEQGQYVLEKYKADSQFLRDKMEQLTIPSFALAARQGQREMTSLKLQSLNAIQQATQPYRPREIWDPLKPIPGLSPVTIQPTMEQGPSTMSVLGGAFLSGLNGAMQGYDSRTNTFY
jgi:hypothetical protein